MIEEQRSGDVGAVGVSEHLHHKASNNVPLKRDGTVSRRETCTEGTKTRLRVSAVFEIPILQMICKGFSDIQNG